MVACLPIYLAGVSQIVALDVMLTTSHTFTLKLLTKRPLAFFSVALIPGVILLILYWVEMYARGMTPYSVNGYVIRAQNISYTLIATYTISILTTFYGLFRSILTYRKLKANFERMISVAQSNGIPGYVVFQVLQIGYTIPFVGFIFAFEWLIWIFPSVINVYIGTFAMMVISLSPILAFINNGSHKNIYPLVPLFSKVLEQIYVSSSKEQAWNPFYSKSTPESDEYKFSSVAVVKTQPL
ncbi:hypothetical protein HDV04_001834 [Boothiomyces sp. JEL0838]|nr:hypothetical protein HDV04_001834 [Boothiomyces sp. JEL0838]